MATLAPPFTKQVGCTTLPHTITIADGDVEGLDDPALPDVIVAATAWSKNPDLQIPAEATKIIVPYHQQDGVWLACFFVRGSGNESSSAPSQSQGTQPPPAPTLFVYHPRRDPSTEYELEADLTSLAQRLDGATLQRARSLFLPADDQSETDTAILLLYNAEVLLRNPGIVDHPSPSSSPLSHEVYDDSTRYRRRIRREVESQIKAARAASTPDRNMVNDAYEKIKNIIAEGQESASARIEASREETVDAADRVALAFAEELGLSRKRGHPEEVEAAVAALGEKILVLKWRRRESEIALNEAANMKKVWDTRAWKTDEIKNACQSFMTGIVAELEKVLVDEDEGGKEED